MGNAFELAAPRKHLRYSRTYPGLLPVVHVDRFYYDNHLRLTSFRVHRTRTLLFASDHLLLVAVFELTE